MTNPVPPEPQEPEPVEPESTEEEAPLNRAERRAKANKGEPTHVGPRGDQARKNRGSRPHTKRPR